MSFSQKLKIEILLPSKYKTLQEPNKIHLLFGLKEIGQGKKNEYSLKNKNVVHLDEYK